MAVNIFRPIKFGKEVFIPKSFDQSHFTMDWWMEAGGKVPNHLHRYMDEHFTVTEGEVLFESKEEKIVKKAGETFFVPKGITHSVSNKSKNTICVTVKYSPCSDTHRMFEIVSTLDEENPGKMMNMVKYFYLAPRLGLQEFSTPQPQFIMNIISGIVTVMGKISGWDKLIPKFRK